MSAAPSPHAFKMEWDRFCGLCGRYLEHGLNWFFDLSPHACRRRRKGVSLVFLGFVSINLLINAAALLAHLRNVLPAILHPASVEIEMRREVFFFLALAGYLLIPFFLSSYFALNMAAGYLADVFELEDGDIAREFIRRLALAGGGFLLHVRQGKVAEEDRESPVLKIGGPGLAIVELDSVAVFEKPDGTPHIVGPAQGAGASIALLEGFERFRAALDLRDQYIGASSAPPMSVTGRSLDGLPIRAVEVRAAFSVRRSDDGASAEPSKEQPYPYSARAIENLVYRSSVQVLSDGPHASDLPRSWTETVHAAIHTTIREFIREHNLSEYLASFGAPEVEKAESQERTIQFQKFELTADVSSTARPPRIRPPRFHPRPEISRIFRHFSNRFAYLADYHGFDLHWIDIGTWRIPDKIAHDIISGQHIQAWQITRENAARGSREALNKVFEEAYLAQKARLIQRVPMAASRPDEKSEAGKRERAILTAYWELLGEAADLYYNAGEPLPKELEQALRKLEALLFRGQHYVGRAPTRLRPPLTLEAHTPPAPSSFREARLYLQLLRRLEGDHRKAEWLIEYESQKFPDLKREQVIQYLLDHPELCHI